MAHSQAKPDVRKIPLQPSTPKGQEKHLRGIRKQRPQSSVRESTHLQDIRRKQRQVVFKSKDIRPKQTFSSPLTSNTPNNEDSHSSDVLPKATCAIERSQRPTINSSSENFHHPYCQNRYNTGRQLDRKRKRSRVEQGHTVERARISLADYTVESKEPASFTDKKSDNPVKYWILQGSWPKQYFEPNRNMSLQLSRKPSSSATSYTQSVKKGENPPPHTPEYELQVLAPAGIIMDQQLGEATILDDCKQLCTTLLDAKYEPPKDSLFKDDLFWKTLNRLRSRSEARVLRDITPYIAPSAELLFIRGASDLEHLIEEIQAEWSKCTSLAGPRSKPELTVGFPSSAFTTDDIQKLRYYRAPEKPTLFTGNLYFPFLTCEVKCGENGLNVADRQNARSASTAVNAILQLYRTLSREKELHRKILVFSISHDHAMIKLYGHYPLVNGDKTTFHRYLIRSFDLTEQDGKEKWTSYNFTRKIYDHFAPIILKIIRDAIPHLPEPGSESFMSIANSENESELADLQETTASVSSSQGNERFKRPKLPTKVMLQQGMDRLREQLEQQRKEFMELLKQEKEENKKLTDMLKQRLS